MNEKTAKPVPQDAPDPEASELWTAPPPPRRRPIKVIFVKGADWNGGSEGCIVDEDFQGVVWRAELTDVGVWFVDDKKDRAVFVPYPAIRSVECKLLR